MATVCINCGKKIGAFAIESPFELCNGQLLCAKCAGTLRRDIKNLYDSSNEEAFLAAKKDILEKSKPIYNDVAIMAIAQRIDQIYEKTLYPKFYPEAAAEEKANNEKIKLEASLNALKLAENQQLTTGYDFNGYNITRYVGIISGEVVLGTGFLSEFSASVSDILGGQSQMFADKLEVAKDSAIEKLKIKSAQKGGNAIIGVDFDYITFANNMVGVVANGTSVVIKKIE